MKTIYTAIFGNYDDLKEPLIITPGWQYICFTDQTLESKTWQIIHREVLPEGQQRTARYYKIMFHRHIETEFSMWIDASFIINCDLNEWWKRFKEPMMCVKHPSSRNCVYDEARHCITFGKDEDWIIEKQIDDYVKAGLPIGNGLIQSGILMRQLTAEAVCLCSMWWEQLRRYSVRDQLAFAYAAWRLPIHHLTEYNYAIGTDFLYLYHLHSKQRKTKVAYYKSLNLIE